jgi:hypothetical protein
LAKLDGDAGIVGIAHHPETADAGSDLHEQLDRLATAQIAGKVGDAGDVCSRPCQAGNEAHTHGIGDADHDDGDGRGDAPGHDYRRRGPRQDDVRAARELGGNLRARLGRSRRRAGVDGKVLAFDIAALAQPIAERVQHALRRRRRGGSQDPDAIDAAARLLRARRERPRGRRATEERDELAPPQAGQVFLPPRNDQQQSIDRQSVCRTLSLPQKR